MTRNPFLGHRLTAVALAIPLFAACPVREVSEVPIDQSHEERVSFPVVANGKIDLLFVVDNSGSMGAEQVSLIANFESMLAPLQELPGGLPSLHIGVISTDVGAGTACNDGDDGALQTGTTGCAGLDGRFIVDEDDGSGGRTQNYDGELGATFACMAELGTGGCGFEHPLESIRQALDPEDVVNPGFLREDALLAIIILADEDDCSAFDGEMFRASVDPAYPGETDLPDHVFGWRHSFRCFEYGVVCEDDGDPRALGARENCIPRDDSAYITPVDEFVGFVKSLKPYEEQVIVAGILGNAGPVVVELDEADEDDEYEDVVTVADSCPAPTGDPLDDGADPPIRLDAFLNAFDQRVRTSICDADLSAAMQEIGDYIRSRVHYSCIGGTPADADPIAAGLQLDCVVSEIQNPGENPAHEARLPYCSDPGDPQSSDTLPCYTIEEDLVECVATPTHLSVEVFYPNDVTRPPSTIIDTRCLIE
jgi:hypothetical protein